MLKVRRLRVVECLAIVAVAGVGCVDHPVHKEDQPVAQAGASHSEVTHESLGLQEVRTPAQAANRTWTIMGRTLPLHNLESIPPTEPSAIEGTNNVFDAFFKKQYLTSGPQTDLASGIKTAGTRRGVHPKAHGCILGTMTVGTNLQAKDRVGIFDTGGAQYQVLARFSNGNSRPNTPDKTPDARGFAMKVYGVREATLLSGMEGGEMNTQDFTMVSGGTFFAQDAAHYFRFMQIALNETDNFSDAAAKHIKETFLSGKPGLGIRVTDAFLTLKGIHTSDPLSIPYFSVSPFQHGTGPSAPVVKYSVEPCAPVAQGPIDENDPSFLRNGMKKHINNGPACYKFLVTEALDYTFPVEDPTFQWNELRSPPRELARIDFPAQQLGDDMACEKSVINPWNTLPEHRPIGGINRLRLAAYLKSIDARKKTNGY